MPEIIKYSYNNTNDSYDLYDGGKRHLIIHESVSMEKIPDLPLIPMRFSDISRRDHRWFKHVNYPWLAIEMVLLGAMEYNYGTTQEIVEAGSIRILIPGSCSRLTVHGDRMQRKVAILARGRALDSILNAVGWHEDFTLHPTDPAECERRIRAVGAAIRSKDANAASATLYELIIDLSSEHRSNPLPEELRKIVDLIRQTPANPPGVEALVASAGCSAATLRRRFSEYFGISPLEYISRFRLNHAAELLQNHLAVKEVASACGFGSSSRFIAAFRQRYGISPKKYQNSFNDARNFPAKIQTSAPKAKKGPNAIE